MNECLAIMKNLIYTISSFFQGKSTLRNQVKKSVTYSVKKYSETYKLLEKYDSEAAKSPSVLSRRSNMRRYLQSI